MVAHLDKVLRVVAIYGLQTIVVAHHYGVAVDGLAREAHRAGKHGLHGIALGGLYLQVLAVDHTGLAHGQGKGIVCLAQSREIHAEGIAPAEEAWGGDENLLLLDLRELMGAGGSTGQDNQPTEENGYETVLDLIHIQVGC